LPDFLMNYSFNIKYLKDRLFFAKLLKQIDEKLKYEETILTRPDILEFINKYEKVEVYDDETILKKITAYCLITKSASECETINAAETTAWYFRRVNMMFKIIENNKEYTPLIKYILLNREISICYENKVIDMNELNESILKEFPESEFSAAAALTLSDYYDVEKKDYQKAVELCNYVFKNFKNFFTGSGDIYSTTYAALVILNYELKNKDKMIEFLGKINKNINSYEKYEKSYNKLIEKLSSGNE